MTHEQQPNIYDAPEYQGRATIRDGRVVFLDEAPVTPEEVQHDYHGSDQAHEIEHARSKRVVRSAGKLALRGAALAAAYGLVFGGVNAGVRWSVDPSHPTPDQTVRKITNDLISDAGDKTGALLRMVAGR